MPRFTISNSIPNTYPISIDANNTVSVANIASANITASDLTVLKTAITDSLNLAQTKKKEIDDIITLFTSNTILTLQKNWVKTDGFNQPIDGIVSNEENDWREIFVDEKANTELLSNTFLDTLNLDTTVDNKDDDKYDELILNSSNTISVNDEGVLVSEGISMQLAQSVVMTSELSDFNNADYVGKIAAPAIALSELQKEQDYYEEALVDIRTLVESYTDFSIRFVQTNNTTAVAQATTIATANVGLTANGTTISIDVGTWNAYSLRIGSIIDVNIAAGEFGTAVNTIASNVESREIITLANDTHGTINTSFSINLSSVPFTVNTTLNSANTQEANSGVSNTFTIDNYKDELGFASDAEVKLTNSFFEAYDTEIDFNLELTTELESVQTAAEIAFNIDEKEEEEEEEVESDDTWKSVTPGGKELNKFFERAERAFTANKAALAIAKKQYEAAKILALASIDPVYAAATEIINQIDNLLVDLENVGFYMLPVTPTSMKGNPNVKEAAIGNLFEGGEREVYVYVDNNGEERGYIDGKTHPLYPPLGLSVKNDGGAPGGYTDAEVPNNAKIYEQDGSRKVRSVPYYTYTKSEQGKKELFSSSSTGDVVSAIENTDTGLLQMTPSEVISTMVTAFDDQGDVLIQQLDKNGKVIGTVKNSSRPKNEAFLDIDETNFRVVDNKPTFSENASVGALAIVIALPSLKEFADAIASVLNFFDFKEFKAFQQRLQGVFKKKPITLKLNNVSLKVKGTSSDVNSPQFSKTAVGKFGDLLTKQDPNSPTGAFADTYYLKADGTPLIIIGKPVNKKATPAATNAPFVGRVVKSLSSKKMEVIRAIPADDAASNYTQSQPVGIEDIEELPPHIRDQFTKGTKSGYRLVDINENIGYQEEELLVIPISGTHNTFPGTLLMEAVETTFVPIQGATDGEGLTTGKEGSASMPEGTDSDKIADFDYTEKEYTEKSVAFNPIEGVVCGQIRSPELPPASTPPDWEQLSLKSLVPEYGLFITQMRAQVNGMRSYVKTGADGIKATIKSIDEQVKTVEKVAEAIIAIQGLLANGLNKAGIYGLALEPETGGTARLKQRLQSAENKPPDNLKFSAGILLVGGSPDASNFDAINKAHENLKKLVTTL